MRKLVTKDQEIDFSHNKIYYDDLPNDIENIKLVGDEYIDLFNLNLNIVKYDIDNYGVSRIDIDDCNINKLVLSEGNRRFFIKNSTINNIYIQSEVMKLEFMNTNIPNLHGRVDLINEIRIDQ